MRLVRLRHHHLPGHWHRPERGLRRRHRRHLPRHQLGHWHRHRPPRGPRRANAEGRLVNRVAGVVVLVVSTLTLVTRIHVEAAAGALDASFGVNGIVTTDVGSVVRHGASGIDHDAATALAVLGDGRIVVAGFASNGQPGSDAFVLARYGTDGALDPQFGSAGLAVNDLPGPFGAGGDDQARALALRPDNGLIVAGSASGDMALARLTADGRLDTEFGNQGTVTTDPSGRHDNSLLGVAVRPNGRIVTAGWSAGPGRSRRFTVFDLTDSGAGAEPAFTTFGGQVEEAHAVALQPDGRVVVAGVSAIPGHSVFAVARYLPDGRSPDGSFGDGGTAIIDLAAPDVGPASGGARAVAVQPDGAIVVAGAAPAPPTKRPAIAVARLRPDGRPDPAFGTNGRVFTTVGDTSGARGVAVTPHGKIIAAGAGGSGQVTVVRYNPDGSPDASFGPNGGAVTSGDLGSAANGVAVQPDGRSVVAGITPGHGTAQGNGTDFVVARYLADPMVSIGDARIGEGDTGQTEGRFKISLSAPAGNLGVSVDYATVDATAVAPRDYRPATGTVRFAPGQIEASISVFVKGDRRDAANRVFFVNLTNPAHATLARPQAAGTIIDDEPLTTDIVGGGPGAVARLHFSAIESGAVLSEVCLDPRRAPCLDLGAIPSGSPNPLVVKGITFLATGSDGTPRENIQVVNTLGQRGLVVGDALDVWLPGGTGAAALRLSRTGPPASVEAFAADGLSLATAITTANSGVPEILRLPPAPALEVPQQPFGVAVVGPFVYVADPVNHRVQVIDPATGPGCPCETDVASALAGPYAVAAGAPGPQLSPAITAPDLFIADTDGNRVLRVTTDLAADPPEAAITTVAGTGALGFGGDGGPGKAALLKSPYGVAYDPARRLVYLSDTLNHRIRAVSADGKIATVAGDGTPGYAGDGGPGVAARFNGPRGLAVGDDGALFIADTGNHAVRRLDPGRATLTTVAGSGVRGFGGDGGSAGKARLDSPAGVAVAGKDLYVADTGNHRIRRVQLTTGTITTVAGNGRPGFSGDGGEAARARLSSPFGVAVGPAGALYVADTGNNRIRVVAGTGGGSPTITTLAGNGTPAYRPDPASAALAGLPDVSAVAAWDPGGDDRRSRTFVGDPTTGTVRQIDERGRITTLLGDGVPGSEPGRLASPLGLATDRASPPRFIYVADTFNNVVRRIDLGSGQTATVAGTGRPGFGGDGGPATLAQLSFPTGLSVDRAGNLYIADTYNARIRRVDTNGIITTVAGTGRVGFAGDGGRASSADLSFPYGIATTGQDPADVYVADSFNHRVRRIDGSSGLISTVAGNGVAAFAGDGGAARAGSLSRPWGVAVDDAPRPAVYIADRGNGRIRLVDGTSGLLSTLSTGTTTLTPLDPRAVAVPRRLTGGAEVDPAPGKIVLVADSRNGQVTRTGLALAETNATALAFTTTTSDFGCTRTCMTKTVTLTNPGSATLAVQRILIQGDHAGDFRVTADGCTRRPVGRGQQCALRIAFSPLDSCPSAAPCRRARLVISANNADGDREVLLAGGAVRQIVGGFVTLTHATREAAFTRAEDAARITAASGAPAPTGSVDFYLCGPMSGSSGCPSGGTRVGGPRSLDSGRAYSEQAAVPVRDSATRDYWCWRAEYGGDRVYLPSTHTDDTAECFWREPNGEVRSPG